MARTLEATPQLRIMFALHKTRTYRHHRDCQCRKYGGEDCTAASAMWARTMNRELENYFCDPSPARPHRPEPDHIRR